MTELSTAKSFIVRVYRYDTEDDHKITGLLEALDGSGVRVPFTDIDELAAVLKRSADRRSGQRKQRKPGLRLYVEEGRIVDRGAKKYEPDE